MPAGGEPPALTFTTAQLASMLGAELRGPGDVVLDDIGPIDDAGPRALTFVRDARYARRWPGSRAGAALVSRALLEEPAASALVATDARALLVVDDAERALMALLAQAEALLPRTTLEGVHPSAAVDPTAEVAPGAALGPHASVGAGSSVGAGAVLHAGVRVGLGVRIGEGTELRAGVVVEDRCVIGRRCLLHPGAVIGADGFGYQPGGPGVGPIKIPHLGAVVIGDDVEIGANTTIDRGKFGPTRVGDRTKIDNQVQIGHNCVIGEECILCGCVGVAGSVTLGDRVTIAGGGMIGDNLEIGDGATIAGGAGVMRNVPPGEVWMGLPARPVRSFLRSVATLNALPQTVREFRERERDRGQEGAG